MLFQVVHCHPLADSYNHALLRVIVSALESRGHEVVATDLYAEGFDPVMPEKERRRYYYGDYTGPSPYTDLLRRIDGIILCFPHWWFAMPAMLKGYFDRVWGPGIAFVHDPRPAAGSSRS